MDKPETNDIVSGVDLHYPSNFYAQAAVVINVLDSHGLADIDEWIKQYDLNYPKNAEVSTQTFNGVMAKKYTYSNQENMQNRALYFIKGKYAYRIWFWGKSDENLAKATEIVDSFATQ